MMCKVLSSDVSLKYQCSFKTRALYVTGQLRGPSGVKCIEPGTF